MEFKEGYFNQDYTNSINKFLFDSFVLFPSYLEIYPTNVCNHNCNFCISKVYRSNKNTLDTDIVIGAARAAKLFGNSHIRLCGGGEPLLHPEINKILLSFSEMEIQYSITTNGHRFGKSLNQLLVQSCTEIRISIDAGNDKIYSKVHGVNSSHFNTLLHQITEIVKMKGSRAYPIIELSFVITNDNLQSLIELIKISSEIGVNVLNITGNTLIDEVAQNAQLEIVRSIIWSSSSDNLEIYFHNSPPDEFLSPTHYFCPLVLLFGVIDANGFYYPSCHHVKFEQYIMGKITKEHTILDLISSKKFRNYQLNYIFKKGDKLKKFIHNPINIRLVQNLMQNMEYRSELVNLFNEAYV